MFRGLVAASVNSPHLRKFGSRALVSDFGDEVGNGVEEGFSQTEPNGVKSAGQPMNTISIMPSLVLLWRFKLLLFFILGFICCKAGWDSVRRTNADLRDLFLYEAFLYYNPILLVTMMVWLWGSNLWVLPWLLSIMQKILILIKSIFCTERYGSVLLG